MMPTKLRTLSRGLGRGVLSGVLATVIATTAGCGGDRAFRSAKSATPVAAEPIYAESTASASADGVADDAPAPAAPMAEHAGRSEMAPGKSARLPAPQDRPGLGTQWGETRSSSVRDVEFVRADSDRPFAAMTLHYNDRKGVVALARREADRGEAQAVSARGFDTSGGVVTVSLRGEDGEPLDAFRVRDRTFIIGEEGERYSIVLTNRTSARIEAVATVDGLDVINGSSGSLSNRGYVIMPFGSVEIDGFRRSERAVAAFRFAGVGESYAAQMGAPRNVGVIGVALFSERGDAFPAAFEQDLRLRDSATAFPDEPSRFARRPRR